MGVRVISPFSHPVALRFDSATSNRVNFGNARVGNLTDTDFLATLIAVIRMRATVLQGVVLSKNGVDGQGGPLISVNTNQLRTQFNKSVANGVAGSSTGIILVDEWYCIMGIVDVSDSQPRCYYSRVLTREPLVEVTYAGGATQGSGTSVSTANVTAGNLGNASPTAGFAGDIHRVAWYGQRLTPAQGTQWLREGYVSGAVPRINCWLGISGSSIQFDESGYHNHGRIEGNVGIVDGPDAMTPTRRRRAYRRRTSILPQMLHHHGG